MPVCLFSKKKKSSFIFSFNLLFYLPSFLFRDVLGVTHITNDMDGDGKDSVVKKGGATDKLRSGYRKQERNYRDISREFSGIGDDDEEY